MGVKEGLVLKAIAAHRAQPPQHSGNNGVSTPSPAPAAPAAKAAPPPRLELKLLAILADHPTLWETAETLEIRSLLTDARLRDMYSAARQGADMLSAAPPEISDIVAREVFAGSYASVEDPRRTLVEAVHQLRQSRIADEVAELQRRIKDAERRGDTAQARECLARITTLRQAQRTPHTNMLNNVKH
jgi:hypothetical protein